MTTEKLRYKSCENNFYHSNTTLSVVSYRVKQIYVVTNERYECNVKDMNDSEQPNQNVIREKLFSFFKVTHIEA